MKESLFKMMEALKGASGTSRAIMLAAVGLLLLVAGFFVYDARTPHFILLYGPIESDSTAARVQAALAGGGIRFKVSQPPAPYFIHVDESAEYEARNLVALANAMDPAPHGIQNNHTGASSVFLSADERIQSVMKREWEEMEKQLEVLDFVVKAKVTTSVRSRSGLRAGGPATVSVTLRLDNGYELTGARAETVAKIVRFRFGVPEENVMISDHTGRTLFDGSKLAGGVVAEDLLKQRLHFEEVQAGRINESLDTIFGPGKAEVVISSKWGYDQSEKVTERLDPQNKVVVSESKQKTKTPAGFSGNIGGPAGVASNLATSLDGNTPAPPAGSGGGEASTTEDSQKSTIVGRETEHVLSKAPVLERLSVALMADESLAGELAELESTIKQAVGFDEARGDTFSSLLTPFATVLRDEEGKVIEPVPAEPIPEPNRMMEVLLERGVEIASALAFIFLLFKVLKGSSSGKKTGDEAQAGAPGGRGAETDEDLDVELLARATVDDLLKSDPERVGKILSRWAAEDTQLAKSAK